MNRKQPPNIDPTKIHLFSVNVFQGGLKTDPALLESSQVEIGKSAHFNMGVEQELAHNIEDRLTRIRLYFQLIGLEKESGEAIGLEAEYGIEFHFKVDNFSDFVKDKDGEVLVDRHIAATLLGIAYSTARGILLERLQGTLFGSVLIPVVSPYQVLEEGE